MQSFLLYFSKEKLYNWTYFTTIYIIIIYTFTILHILSLIKSFLIYIEKNILRYTYFCYQIHWNSVRGEQDGEGGERDLFCYHIHANHTRYIICMCLVWFAFIWDIIYIEKWRARWERGDQYFVVFSDSCESTWIQCSWNKFGPTYLDILRIWTYLDAPKYDKIKIRNTANLNLSVSKQLAPKPVRFM